ncbi:MAG: hypothetical protein M3209_15170 [Acidobacteriota bacterium]|nr:hypothetical protein [Acidobacteriota bacterium]
MNTLLNLTLGIVYILALFCLMLIVFVPGIGFWTKQDEIGYAIDVPAYLRISCFILLILLLSGGLYFLRGRIPSLF